MRKFFTIALGLFALLTLPLQLWAEQQGYKVGVILSLSGESARYGALQKDGILSAKDTSVKFIFEDEGACQPAKALSAFRKLVHVDKVHGIIGPSCGTSQQILTNLIAQEQIPTVLSNSGSRSLSRLASGWLVSPAYSIEDESEFNAAQLTRRGYKRVVLVFYDNLFSRAHEAAFRAKFEGSVLDTITFNSIESSALKPVVLSLKRLRPDIVYVPDVLPFLLGLAQQALTQGVKIPFWGTYATEMPGVIEPTGHPASNIYYSYPQVKADAITFYAERSARLMLKLLHECLGEASCMHKAFADPARFNEFGVSRSSIPFEVKTVRSGMFVAE